MIFDHENKIAYGSVSLRLDEELFRDFCKKFGFEPVVFHSYQNRQIMRDYLFNPQWFEFRKKGTGYRRVRYPDPG